MKLEFRKWLEAGEVWGVEPPVQNPALLQAKDVPTQGCDGAGGFPCISLDKEDLPPTPKKKMKKQKKS